MACRNLIVVVVVQRGWSRTHSTEEAIFHCSLSHFYIKLFASIGFHRAEIFGYGMLYLQVTHYKETRKLLFSRSKRGKERNNTWEIAVSVARYLWVQMNARHLHVSIRHPIQYSTYNLSRTPYRMTPCTRHIQNFRTTLHQYFGWLTRCVRWNSQFFRSNLKLRLYRNVFSDCYLQVQASWFFYLIVFWTNVELFEASSLQARQLQLESFQLTLI